MFMLPNPVARSPSFLLILFSQYVYGFYSFIIYDLEKDTDDMYPWYLDSKKIAVHFRKQNKTMSETIAIFLRMTVNKFGKNN